ncbi:sulfite exporter TauE/SafE family protein [Flavobacterium sp. NRK F10]|uniref:Probable membrane transporter protein n=1 Tax=Flavobacterium sediminis TaxID=2201181 RepID=A0A2U8QXC7_9FLAO|nr:MULTISPECIES: sulfite exporter TauE/SafE family protein [Flavobacterium]AWM14870.1 hypothetical protein DI487_14080 [Flavobacterium sediminis]MCO6176114.1 sulfite exporter TauE/SafE family protein [Flavobacterium sp. NRK F10]
MDKISYLFLLLTLLAEIVGTVGGFGSSVFFVPMAGFFFDFQSVLGLTAIFHLASNISKISLFRKGLDKKLLLRLGLPSVIFVIVGAMLTKFINAKALEIILGIFLIIFSSFLLWKKDFEIRTDRKETILGGSLSGFTAGLLGTGGAIRGVTMAAFNLEKEIFIATSAAIDFSIDFTRTFVYFGNGYIHTHDLIYVPFLVVIGFVGTYIGKYFLNFIPQDKFKSVSLILVLLIGIVTLSKILFF